MSALDAPNSQDAAAEPTVSGSQSEVAVAPAPDASATRPVILSPEQHALLTAILDTLVPPHGSLAGAGALGVVDAVEGTLAQTLKLRRVFLHGLAEIEVASQRQHGVPFVDLAAAQREPLLKTVEEAQPAFFAALVEHTYRGYYTLPQVQAAIGYPARPPQPLGHELAPFREELLQIQRGRQPFWRPTGP